VQIISGEANRGKLLYALPEPLPSKSFADGAFELRCGTSAGKTTQDLLPPSIHPNGRAYHWIGDWHKLPPFPSALLEIWKKEFRTQTPALVAVPSADTDELRVSLKERDPNCGYDEWIKAGMAVHHETEGSQDGLLLWDEWSQPAEKYPGLEILQQHWQSFGHSKFPVTGAYLRSTGVATVDEFDDISEEMAILDAQSEERNKEGFRFLSLPELFNRPTPDWIIPGVLPRGAIGAVWGQPGAGKTFLSVDMAMVVALGQCWRDKEAEQGEVLYIAAEDDTGVQIRFQAALAARGAQDAPVRVLPATPVLTSPEQAKALQASIMSYERPSLIFVDTLAAVTPGSDENAAKDMGLLVHYCQQLNKATGALIMLVHHEGKSIGRGPRGWSGLRGAFDVEWAVTEEGLQRQMQISKMKNASTGEIFSFRLAAMGKSCVVEWG